MVGIVKSTRSGSGKTFNAPEPEPALFRPPTCQISQKGEGERTESR
jgi:hypothetical protein